MQRSCGYATPVSSVSSGSERAGSPDPASHPGSNRPSRWRSAASTRRLRVARADLGPIGCAGCTGSRPTSPTVTLNWHRILIDFGHDLGPCVPWLVVVVVLLAVLFGPLPGRGPRLFQRRDPWRTFKYGLRATVLGRAGGRCEAPLLLVVARCRRPAVEVEHIYPWSRRGATVASNGQALRAHNRHKGNFRPPWWYVLGLERRRRSYFPVGASVRVSAASSTQARPRRR